MPVRCCRRPDWDDEGVTIRRSAGAAARGSEGDGGIAPQLESRAHCRTKRGRCRMIEDVLCRTERAGWHSSFASVPGSLTLIYKRSLPVGGKFLRLDVEAGFSHLPKIMAVAGSSDGIMNEKRGDHAKSASSPPVACTTIHAIHVLHTMADQSFRIPA